MKPASCLRFGAFELDLDALQLTRSGRRVHVTPQALRILALLAERAGEVVTREEIRRSLWGADTFVDFETAMNACVSQLRAVLADKPSAPRFIETVPRRGYRFVAPVGRTAVAEPPPTSSSAIAAEPATASNGRSLLDWWLFGSLTAAVAVLVAAATLAGGHAAPAPPAFAKNSSLSALQKLERGASGLADASPSELLDRVKHFEAAIAVEPDFAEAYTGLAEAKLIIAAYRAEPPQVAYPAAKAAAAKALSLNPDLGQAHAAYAAAVLHFEWDWDTARAHLARAESLAPSSPRVHHWQSRYLSARGRHAEAIRHARRAQALVPTSPSALTNVGVAAFYGGDTVEAKGWCERAVRVMREFVPAHHCLAAIAAENGGREAATPDPILGPAVAFARAADRERALEWLQRAANRRTDALIFSAVQPAFAGLRQDPRFVGVLERVGLRNSTNPSN